MPADHWTPKNWLEYWRSNRSNPLSSEGVSLTEAKMIRESRMLLYAAGWDPNKTRIPTEGQFDRALTFADGAEHPESEGNPP